MTSGRQQHNQNLQEIYESYSSINREHKPQRNRNVVLDQNPHPQSLSLV